MKSKYIAIYLGILIGIFAGNTYGEDGTAADWKSFENREIGFQMNYGPGWEIKRLPDETQNTPGSVVFLLPRGSDKSGAAIGISLMSMRGTNLTQVVADHTYKAGFKRNTVFLDGREAIRLEKASKEKHQVDLFIQKDKNSFWFIQIDSHPEDSWSRYQPFVEKVLKSFRFI